MANTTLVVSFNESAPKRATNVNVNSDLLDRAKGLGINLSQTLERTLAELVRARMREQFLADNRESIEAYNRQVEESGVFGDHGRTF